MTADNQVTLEEIVRATPISSLVGKFGWNSHDEAKAGMTAALQPAINSGGEVERVQLAVAELIYGPGFDPFNAPETFDWCESIAHAALAAMDRAPGVEDSRPDFVGSPQAKIEAYNQMHETAVELGYPSILEALEALEDLSQPEPRPVEAGEDGQDDVSFANALISGFRKTSGCYYADAKGVDHWIVKAVATHRQQPLSAARAEIEGLRGMLLACREKFDFYRRSHEDKNTDEGDSKALTNLVMVQRIDAALSTDQGREGK